MEKKEQQPWKINANSFLVLFSILAAVGGVFLALVFQAQPKTPLDTYWYLPVSFLVLSLILFIFSAEALTDALDEDDVKKYIATLVVYDFAVFCLLTGLYFAIFFQYVFNWFNVECPCLLIRVLILIVVDTCLTFRWCRHICWLLFEPRAVLQDYIDELCGDKPPTIDREKMGWSYWYLKIRGMDHNTTALAKTTIELKPSSVAGIGVFAVIDFNKQDVIEEGIHSNDYDEIIPWEALKQYDNDIKERINSFCIGTVKGFFPPPNNNFDELTVGWYMNHSCEGNVGFNGNGDFIAIQNIKKGEELTYDYGLAESNPQFSLACSCNTINCRKIITGNDWKNENFRKNNRFFMLPKLRDFK
jgi:hypothetical protein